MIIYNILFVFLSVLTFPLWSVMVMNKKKWLDIFLKRSWIRIPGRINEFRNGIWVHSLSVGEVLSSDPLVRKLYSKSEKPIIVSVSTLTGYETAARLFQDLNVLVVFFPFDFLWSVKRALNTLDPASVIIIENDVWPNFIWLAKKMGMDLVWANARVSDRSFPRYFALRKIAGPLFNLFDIVLTQTVSDKLRLIRIGAGEEKIIRTGNLKFDRDYTKGVSEGLTKRDLLNSDEGCPVFTFGSTHPGEEDILLDAYENVNNALPDAIFVIAPRNPERAQEIAKAFEKRKHEPCLFSMIAECKNSRIIIVDCLGRLLEIYSVSDVAFIGGSLLPYGGHNPLEPASFGKPVFFGPHMNDFREIADNMHSSGGASTVFLSKDLSEKLIELFSDKRLCDQMGTRANESYKKERGVSDLCMDALKVRFPGLFR